MKVTSKPVVVSYLLAVFIVGLAIGVASGYALAKKAPPQLPPKQKFEDGWLAVYRSELGLSEEQVQAIQPLLRKPVEDLGGIWYRAIMTMGAVHESVDRRIEPLLDERQREELVALIKKGREKRLRIAGAKFSEQTGKQDHIYYAAAIGDGDAIRGHLQAGVEIDKRDLAFGMTPLAVAATHGHPDAVQLLLKEGADVNAQHPDGSTALHAAAFFGRPVCVERLLAAGVDITARNGEGKTALEVMDADWETTEFIGAILQVELTREEVLAGRETVAQLLAAAGGGLEEASDGVQSPNPPRR